MNFVLMFNHFVINSYHHFFPLPVSILPFYFEGEFFDSLQDWEIIPPSPKAKFSVLGGFLAVKFIWDVMCLTAPKLKLLLDQLKFGTCFENAFGRVNNF